MEDKESPVSSKSPSGGGSTLTVLNSNPASKQRKSITSNGPVAATEHAYAGSPHTMYGGYPHTNAAAAYHNAANMGLGMPAMQFAYPSASMSPYPPASAQYLSGGAAMYQTQYSLYPTSAAATYSPLSYARQSILYPSAPAHHGNSLGAASELGAPMAMIPASTADLASVAGVSGATHAALSNYYSQLAPATLATQRGMPGMIPGRYPMTTPYWMMNEAANASFSLPYHSITPLVHPSAVAGMDPNAAAAAAAAAAYAQSMAVYGSAMERQKKAAVPTENDTTSLSADTRKRAKPGSASSPSLSPASVSPSSPSRLPSSSSSSILRVRVLLRSERGKRFRSRLVRIPLNQSLSQLLFRAVSINKFVSVRVSDGRGETFFGNEEQSMADVVQKMALATNNKENGGEDGDEKHRDAGVKRKKLYQGIDERFDAKAHELFFMHDDEWTVAHRAAALKVRAQEHKGDGSVSLAATATDSDLLVCFILDDQVKSCPRLGCQNLLFKHSHRRSCLTCARLGWDVPAAQIRKLVLKVELRKKRKIGGIGGSEMEGIMAESGGSSALAKKDNANSNSNTNGRATAAASAESATGGNATKGESVATAQQEHSLSMSLDSAHFNEYEILSKLSFGPFEQAPAKDKSKSVTAPSPSASPSSSSFATAADTSSTSDYVLPCASLSSLLPSLSVNDQLTLLDSALAKCEHWKFDAEGDFSSFRNLYSSYHSLLQSWLGNRFYDPSEDNSATAPAASAAAATVESKQIVHSIYILFLSESDAKATDLEYYRFLQERFDIEWSKLERLHSSSSNNEKRSEVKKLLKSCCPLTVCDPSFSYSVKMRSHFWLLQVRKESGAAASSSAASNADGGDGLDDALSDDGFQKDGPTVHGSDRLTPSTKNMKLFKKIGKPNQRRMKRKPEDSSTGRSRRSQSPMDDDNDSDDSATVVEASTPVLKKKLKSLEDSASVKKESRMVEDEEKPQKKGIIESGNESIRSAALVLTQVKRETHSPKEESKQLMQQSDADKKAQVAAAASMQVEAVAPVMSDSVQAQLQLPDDGKRLPKPTVVLSSLVSQSKTSTAASQLGVCASLTPASSSSTATSPIACSSALSVTSSHTDLSVSSSLLSSVSTSVEPSAAVAS